ncbi:MAG: Flagella basal body P-ring formation protein FlgA precursor [Pseudomonadota bacterium]
MKLDLSDSQRPQRPFSQGLCRPWAGALALSAAALLGGPLTVLAKAADANATVPWPAAATPDQALARAVTQWIGTQHGVDPSTIRLAPLDPRLQIKPCTAGLRIDFPFASQETVRVRCESLAWQLFMRTLPPAPGAAPVTPRPVAAGVGAGSNASPNAGPNAGPEDKAAVRKVVVTTGLLQRGTRVSADQLVLMDMPAHNLPTNVLDRIDDALNAEVMRDVPNGSIVRSHDLRPALMVRRGQLVMVAAGSASGFRVVARLEALQDGRMGEQIKLKNKESGRQISAVVTGLNTADAL